MSAKNILALTVVALLICSTSATAAVYQVTDVGTDHAYAMGLNEQGRVVGYVRPDDSWSQAYGFLWDPGTGLTSLGGYAAYAINDLGQIAGKSGKYQAAVWENGGWVILENRQEAVAINNKGQVTGLISAQPSVSGPYAPFRDDDIYAPGFITLQPPYARASHGYDINNKGQVVADCGTGLPGTLYVGVFYDSDTTRTILDNGGNYDAHSRAINDFGQIVGQTQVLNHDDHLAVFWDSPDGDLEYMGSLGDGAGYADAINNLTQAVGSSAGRAFIWTPDDGMLDLNTRIDPALGITLTRATDIADSGAIVAWGLDSLGRKRSYLLTPPPPLAIHIDIRPAACPNPINLRSRGLLPVAVLGADALDVSEIDVASVRLEGVAPVRSTYLDVAAPAPTLADCECSTPGPDGHADLLLKFRTRDIVGRLLTIHPDLVHGDVIPLTLTASLADDTRLQGVDCVVIRGKAPKRITTKLADLNGDGFVNVRDFALIAQHWLRHTGTE